MYLSFERGEISVEIILLVVNTVVFGSCMFKTNISNILQKKAIQFGSTLNIICIIGCKLKACAVSQIFMFQLSVKQNS